jgi:hypothetical protein
MSDQLASLLSDHTPDVAAIVWALRDVVVDALPGVTEQLDLPDHLLAFGYGQGGGIRMRGMLVALIPHAAHVNVQLADGAALPDPGGMIEGTGKRIRHVKCRSLDDVRRPALRAILLAQSAMRTV